MKASKRRIVFFSTVVTTVLFGAETSNLRADDDVGTIKVSEKEALEEDLTDVAKAKGWTIEQARADYEAAEAVGRVAVELAAKRPEIFVGSMLSEVPGESPMLLVKGRADQSVYDLVAKEEINITIVDEQPFSFTELEKRKTEVHQALMDMGYQNFVTSAGIQYGGNVIVTLSKQPNLPYERNDILTFLPKGVRDNVAIIVKDKPIAVDEDAFGGMHVTDGGVNECTSGWSLELYTWGASVPWAVTTAGHCGGIDGIREPGVGIHNFPIYDEHRGAWGDVEMHNTNTTITAEFYAKYNEIRDTREVEAVASMSVGESVCHYSRVQNVKDCTADINDVSIECTASGVWNGRLVQMDDDITVGGDSGSGWFYSYRAYGGHKGDCDGLSTFSAADYFDNALNPTLPTGYAVRVLLD